MKNIIRSDPQKNMDNKILSMECIGTLAVCYVSSSIIIYGDLHSISQTSLAIAHALLLLIFMWIAIPISGAHFNPAITIGLLVVKKVDWSTGLMYLIAQCVGSVLGALLVYIQMSEEILDKIKTKSVLGIPHPGNNDYEISGFWGEAFGFFFIMFVYMAVVNDSLKYQTRSIAAPAFAFSVYIATLTLSEISGAGLNPVRSLGPAVVVGSISKVQLIHIFGPLIGSICASVFYSSIFIDDDDDERDNLQNEKNRSERQNMVSNEENLTGEIKERK